MIKVSEFFTTATETHGKKISGRAFAIFLDWSNEDGRTVWGAFYEKSLLNEMLSYALSEITE